MIAKIKIKEEPVITISSIVEKLIIATLITIVMIDLIYQNITQRTFLLLLLLIWSTLTDLLRAIKNRPYVTNLIFNDVELKKDSNIDVKVSNTDQVPE